MSITLNLAADEAGNHSAELERFVSDIETAQVKCSCGWVGAEQDFARGELDDLFDTDEPTSYFTDVVFREWTLHVYDRIAAGWGPTVRDGVRAEVAWPAAEWAALLHVLTEAAKADIPDADRFRDRIRDYFD